MQTRDDGRRSWRVEDGKIDPPLRTTLGDGETIAMTWMEQDLGKAFWVGEATIVGCFAQDGRGKEAVQRVDLGRRPVINSS